MLSVTIATKLSNVPGFRALGECYCELKVFLCPLYSTATPERPHSVRASITNESISLIWVEPHHNNAPVLGYQVTFHTPLFLRGDWILINTTVEMTIISGLHPGVVYNFTIVAFNEIGASRPSQVAMIATLDEGRTIRLLKYPV